MFSINSLSVNTFSVDGFGEEGREAGLSGAILRERLLQELYKVSAEGGVAQANFRTVGSKQNITKLNKDQLLQQYIRRLNDRNAEEDDDDFDELKEKYEERIIAIEVAYEGITHRVDAVVNNKTDDAIFQVLNINTRSIDVEPNITIKTLRTSWK